MQGCFMIKRSTGSQMVKVVDVHERNPTCRRYGENRRFSVACYNEKNDSIYLAYNNKIHRLDLRNAEFKRCYLRVPERYDRSSNINDVLQTIVIRATNQPFFTEDTYQERVGDLYL
ncbi:hypothetical protein PPL_07776 [Heterostelium album PN500]|uniref:Uncharacterized protein n=1 Tax=Heterostelium pallidum (strain ATCC 26659 / Pp 5 / PN500) TaxID=670386 RepID=D3BGX4_HETP5|nr:hypothetical protein PPL_07776 [Heterostelium album PN500]EFA79358.1 hypothetical protein PPL_07776 [Heterostelium album PN500]|eukprot:XP_020431479.1 hypothetical protein PPL_07776 [Heterostelium album PN500]